MRRMYLLVTLVLTLLSFLPASSAAAITMISPVDPMVVTSPQGYRIHPITGKHTYHAGVDLDADDGNPIYAAAAGTVTYAGWISGYGLTCAIVIQ